MTNLVNKKIVKIIAAVILLSTFYFLLSTLGVFAQSGSIDVTCAKYDYPWCEDIPKGFSGLVDNFYTIALGLAGASALGVLIYGAILWTLSGAVTSKKDALEWIWGAIWGLVLLLGAYLILNTINPDLVNLQEPEMKQAVLPGGPTEYSGVCCRRSVFVQGKGFIDEYKWTQIPENETCASFLKELWVTALDPTRCFINIPAEYLTD